MHEGMVEGDGASIAVVVISDLRRGMAVVEAVAIASMVEGDMNVGRCWGACTDTIKK
jgi:acid stress-induced BolA-like protein IbaG/YrbA